MKIRLAHLRDQGIDFAVFEADAPSRRDEDRGELLSELVIRARANGLKVDKAALTFTEARRTKFYGSADLVKYLVSRGGIRRWTHEIDY